MTFSQPLALLALLALPALVALYLLHERRRRGAGARFANPALLPALADPVPRLRRHLPVALLLVALAAMIFGVARPHATVTVARKEATVVLAIDVSRSMRARDVRPTRLQAALSTARGFVDELPETFRLGIVSVGSNAIVALPPTDDRPLARAALGALQRSEGTAIGDGIGLALDLARRQRADDGTMLPAAVLLVSDGANEGGRTRPQTAAERARALGVPVHTVLIGTPDGVVERALTGGFRERIRVPANPQTLQLVARASGGQFFRAPSRAALEDVYGQLRTRLGHRKRSRELSDAFAAGSALLLLAGGALSALWFRRVP
ncbi:MAG TPA: VWA domain-containing protein [Gaiellaceae bacterium]|nr:VWA domain-containing protein [Gaiellaceae bacterium]